MRYKYDNNGIYIETVLDTDLENTTEIRPLDGLYKAKFNGLEWIESATQEEIELINNVKPQPTADEILKAKLIKDNADIQLQLGQQQKLNAEILLKLASLGGSANV